MTVIKFYRVFCVKNETRLGISDACSVYVSAMRLFVSIVATGKRRNLLGSLVNLNSLGFNDRGMRKCILLCANRQINEEYEITTNACTKSL